MMQVSSYILFVVFRFLLCFAVCVFLGYLLVQYAVVTSVCGLHYAYIYIYIYICIDAHTYKCSANGI
jgi:hypothetical protein